MSDPDVITLVTTWQQALVAVVLILAVVVWPGVAVWLQGRRTAQVQGTVDSVHSTLTTNNGGSHVRDALDELVAGQRAQALTLAEHGQAMAEMGERLTSVEDVITQPIRRVV